MPDLKALGITIEHGLHIVLHDGEWLGSFYTAEEAQDFAEEYAEDLTKPRLDLFETNVVVQDTQPPAQEGT